jgi:hypothetical protein
MVLIMAILLRGVNRVREWGVRLVLFEANWFAPVFVPVSRRAAASKSSPLAGEIPRLAGHDGRGLPNDLRFLASEPENSHPVSGEDLSLGNGTEMGMQED